MPNWVDQEFALVGPKADLDRWCELAITGNFKADHTREDEPTILFDQVCPIRARDKRSCAEEHRNGVVFRFCRTRAQVHLTIHTSWDLPRHFYRERLLRDWPMLAFCCAANEDMGQFGGLVARFDGAVVDAIEDYDANYSRPEHARRIRSIQRTWRKVLEADRPWHAVVPLRWRARMVIDVDATFNDLANVFHFRSESECRRFVSRRKGAVMVKEPARSRKRRRRTAP
jgi:hypothetical protein